MTLHQIKGVKAKLARAQFHADCFAKTWSDYYHRGIFGYTMSMDADPPHALHFKWQIREQSSDELQLFTQFSLIFGDILTNLRATLDYLAWQLVLAASNAPNPRTSFPCVRNPAFWASTAADRLKGIDANWVDEIERLQPYHHANPDRHLFAVLDHVNNVNKHRALPTTIVTAEKFNFSYHHPDMPKRRFSFEPWLDRPIENGVEFFRLTVDPPLTDPRVGLSDPPIRIGFEDGIDHGDGWGYDNSDLVAWVIDVVNHFEAAFH